MMWVMLRQQRRTPKHCRAGHAHPQQCVFSESKQTMQIIHQALTSFDPGLPQTRIPVERLTLAKRRWRGVAEDQQEFGFDLESALRDGAAVHQTSTTVYILAQKYEPILEVALGADSPTAARLGWMIGNLHFQIEVSGPVVHVVDDPAVRQLFERERIPYVACKRVFHPIAGGHHH
jgi:urease accessory protein